MLSQGSPHGSVMSCQSMAARAFADHDNEMTHCAATFHRSVRFSSDSRSSARGASEAECKRETPGSISLTTLAVTPVASHAAMTQSVPSNNGFDVPDAAGLPSCRFPKLEECAHFHYDRVSLGGLCVDSVPCAEELCQPTAEGWICLKVRSHVNSSCDESVDSVKTLSGSWTEAVDVREWTLTRNKDNLLQLDDLLHRCIYDRKVSGLPNLTEKITPSLLQDEAEYKRLIADYMHHFSIIADDSINCGPVLNWLQMDNKGHKLLVANEDSSSINTPAVAAAYSIRKYVSQARDEISFDVGDMISIIDMPGPQESIWWRGKRGFTVGFFPHNCVAVIGDKVPRHMKQPPPIVGSLAVAPIKPVLRKHGKLISLFRSFILSRPSRRSLKQQGILRERVFGCDLGEHLLNCGRDVPLVLVECAAAIEGRGAVDGVYRLSGGSGLTQRLRAAFDAHAAPDLLAPDVARDPHAVPSLLKMYFRELPNPLCTYQLYESFVRAVQAPEEAGRLRAVRDAVVKLPPPHYRTLAYLMRHLRRISLLGPSTGMTARNMAIVWAPNLLRSPRPQHALQGVAVQAVVTEFLICYAEELFAEEQGDSGPDSLEQEYESHIELRGLEAGRRPKSLPLNPPTKLLSLEEARRRGRPATSVASSPRGPAPQPPQAQVPQVQLRPTGDVRPKYIEVGSGPNNLPQYHTVLDLPIPGKRGVKRSPGGWRGLFSRQKRAPKPPAPCLPLPELNPLLDTEESMCIGGLRPVKSCESLVDSDTLAPLAERAAQPLKHHTRSSSCDSYFEPWQAELAELAGMRLRLAPQERRRRMWRDDDHAQTESGCSSPESGDSCDTPRRLAVDIRAAREHADRKVGVIEEQLSQIGYIDGESPRPRAPEKRQRVSADTEIPKRVCKDRESPAAALAEFSSALPAVKLRERNSPRKVKNNRYSGLHQLSINEPVNVSNTRLSWQGKECHSTLIKVDWPESHSNLTASTITSSPISPITPVYDPLESDSEVSDKHTITIKNCNNCVQEKCLKCELIAADVKLESADSLPSPNSDISYQNLNRLSAVSTSSENSDRKDALKVMTSSHESSSSYSNVSSKEQYLSRPNYINLQSSSSKSSPESPLKSPLKSTISITFRSPTKTKLSDYETISMDTPNNDRDSVYEDVDLDKNLAIVEEATIPETDASLPTQQACQPENFTEDLIILETPTEPIDVYSQVKFFKKSIEEVNAMIFESPEKERHYENLDFSGQNDYENVNVETLQICDKELQITEVDNLEVKEDLEKENGNVIKNCVPKNLNVRELAIRFESPTEQKGPFVFEKFRAEVKYPSLDRKEKEDVIKKEVILKPPKDLSPKTYRLSKHSSTARSLDENAFIKEFRNDKGDRRKSLEVREANKQTKRDLNLNINVEIKPESVTPTSENKISLIQRFEKKPCDIKNFIGFDTEKKLSRERIEKYKEERRNFLREKYSSQSFRTNPEQFTRIKIKKELEDKTNCERLKEELPKFERRNTVDLGQRMRFSLARSSNNLDTIQSPVTPEIEFSTEDFKDGPARELDRKEKVSPSYNIRDMAAMFEQKSQSSGTN